MDLRPGLEADSWKLLINFRKIFKRKIGDFRMFGEFLKISTKTLEICLKSLQKFKNQRIIGIKFVFIIRLSLKIMLLPSGNDAA